MPEPSKYAENQWLTATDGSLIMMSEVIADALPKVTAAATEDIRFSDDKDELTTFAGNWNGAEIALLNAEAAVHGKTVAMEDKRVSLTRKPNVDTNSPIETWDNTIRSAVAYQGTTYSYLLPQGRDTVTKGAIDAQIIALKGLGERLGEQGMPAPILALSPTVLAFATAYETLRTQQTTAKTALTTARTTMETMRVLGCQIMYGIAGTGMRVWRNDPARVDTLFNINILRDPTLMPPEAPADTSWNPTEKQAATSAMPTRGTRLEVWRQGAGDAPELLIIGEAGQLSITVPAIYVFNAGEPYQIWMQARNSRGVSAPGPKQNWTP